MTRTKIDLSPERQLVTHLITSKAFAREILPILNVRDLKTRYAQVVATWVKEYYDKYDDVPEATIQDIYLERKATLRDEEEQESVAEFLQNLSEDAGKESNLDYYTDTAINYLKTRSMEKAVEDIQNALARNDPQSAEGVVANYKRVGRPEGDGYSLTDNPGDIISAFTEESEVVLIYPGILGKVVGPCRRGDLVSFIAPIKRGKTWALLYSAHEAMARGQKCVFITLEMPKAQIIRRAWQAFTGSPKLDGVVTIPYYAPEVEKGQPIPEKDDLEAKWRVEKKDVPKKGIDLHNVEKMQADMKKLNRGGDCRFVPMSAKSTTVQDIETVLDNLLYYNNYATDVLIVDYADLLGAKANEYRHQLDDIWSNLKRVAQERGILVMTATQTNRAGISGEEITPENVAEDMRKLAHVSKFIALNQSKEDRGNQAIRWKVLLERDEPWIHDEAHTLHCLKIGRFVLDSRLKGGI